jgi:hypothetical protein
LIELSAMLPQGDGGARAIPVDLVLQSLPSKPRRAGDEQMRLYRRQCREEGVPALGARRIAALRQALDRDGQEKRPLLVAFDGGYTNKSLFKAIPERTTFIGRVRKDAKLFAPPQSMPRPGKGRRRLYGEALATPEALLNDEIIPWRTTTVFAAGKERTFQYKTVERCRWKGAGEKDLRLIVLRPLSTHAHEVGRRLFFAHPGYLLSSDPDLPVQQALQAYIWRWEIEVGFREQKTQLGLGQAQVRTRPAATSVLQFTAYTYALLLLAAHLSDLQTPPRPLWQRPHLKPARITFGQIISLMRCDLWGRALGRSNKNHFATRDPATTKSPKIQNTLDSAVIYAIN